MAGMWFKNPATGQWEFLSLVGSQGPGGATGPTGGAGATGLTGPTGPTGAPGTPGATGPTGGPGGNGAVGPTGPQGTAGAKGALGATGSQGPQGIQGPVGAQGAVGNAGADHGCQFRSGMATVNPSANANTQGAWCAFSSPYGATPAIAVSLRSSVPGNTYVNCTQTGATAAGFYPVVYRTNTTSCLVDWLAAKQRGTMDREARAFHHDVAAHVYFVQLTELGGAHALVEAAEWSVDEESGILTLFDALGSVVRLFEAGEWTSVQHEYVIEGAY